MKSLPSSAIVCLALLLSAACGPAPTATPVAALPTDTTPPVIASATPALTPTPVPTETPTPTSTQTPTPTNTPTATPIPWADIPLPEGDPNSQAEHLLDRLDEDGFGYVADQLRQLPEIRDGVSPEDVEALGDIVALAINSSDQEVAEAFDIMSQDGIGNQLVSYGPYWNTQLQILFWLAQQGELKINDKLALGIAISNGLWVAMGDDQVDQAVYRDVYGLLDFHRCYNPQVEEYPLMSLVCLTWGGNYSPTGEPYTHPLHRDYVSRPVDSRAYEWNTISLHTLELMRQEMLDRGFLLGGSVRDTVSSIEDFLYFDRCDKDICSPYWQVELNSPTKNNADESFAFFVEEGYFRGDCAIESILVDGFLKSVGIPTTFLLRQAGDGTQILNSHIYVMYYDPDSQVWTADSKQLQVDYDLRILEHSYIVAVFRPPVNYSGYLSVRWTQDGRIGSTRMWHLTEELTLPQIKTMLFEGVPPSTMGQWLKGN